MAEHPFRFGVLVHRWESRQEWIATVRRIEALGYNTVLLPDHIREQFGPLAALQAAADATTTLRCGSFVLDNDFRHPAVLAREVATLDFFSGGRVELGLGAGAMQSDYAQLGLSFDPAPVRLDRLAEAAQIVKAYFSGDAVTFAGRFYQVANLAGFPRPVQQPRPPLLIGGGGQRVLSLAAREADIVGLNVKTRATGPDWADASAAATAQKLAWIRAAAGERFDQIEINVMTHMVNVTDDRDTAAGQLTGRYGLPVDEILQSPHCLIGTVAQICDDLRERRTRYGISYVVVPELYMETLAPVVAQLAGN